MAGLLDSLGGMATGLWDTVKSVGTGVGDFIGLDGQFGLGGASNAFSLANMGGAMGLGTGLAGNGANISSINAASVTGANSEDPYQLWLNNMNGLAGASTGSGASKGLAGLNLVDLGKLGVAGYGAMTQAGLAKNQIANANRWTDSQLAEQARQVAKEQGSTQATTDAYNNLVNRNKSLAGM